MPSAPSASSSRPAGRRRRVTPTPPPPQRGSGFTNSDLAFRGTHVVVGNYHGFNTYDIENPRRPRLLASVVCPGGQGDVSIHGNLLFMSVEQTRGRLDCGIQGVHGAGQRRAVPRRPHLRHQRPEETRSRWRRCRPAADRTRTRSSPIPKDKANIYVYGSGTGAVRAGEELAGCVGLIPRRPNTALFSIDVIKVPLAAPEKAAIVNRPRIFADPKTGALGGLWQGGDHGPGTQTSRMTNQCHDITVFPEIGLAAGACSGNGILMDISDPVNPVRLDHVVDKNFAYWHSATFNNDGTKVVFTDEWGGGGRPRCRATDLPTWGADAIFDIVDRKLQSSAATTRCRRRRPSRKTASRTTVRSFRCRGATSWCRRGIRAACRCSTSPIRRSRVEIAYFDRGPIDRTSSWSPAATGRPTGTTATSTAPRSRAASTCSG